MTESKTANSSGAVTGVPNMVLRLEGAVLLAVMAGAFAHMDFNWWLFAALFLVPDLSMAGYLASKRIGAALYNIGHTSAVPAALGALGLAMASEPAVAVAIVWIAHIGFDRMAGYGLKYGSGFKQTHLG